MIIQSIVGSLSTVFGINELEILTVNPVQSKTTRMHQPCVPILPERLLRQSCRPPAPQLYLPCGLCRNDVLAFWFYIIGLKKISTSLAGLFLNLIPIFGVGGAFIFLGERLFIMQWVGAIIILAAVVGIFRLPKTEIFSSRSA